MASLALIIALHNDGPWLPRFLGSLKAQSFGDFVAIFVDNASEDNSVALVEAEADPRFRLVRLPERQGAGAARNVALKALYATDAVECLCIADPDDVLPPDSLALRYAAYKATGAVVRACHAELAPDGTVQNRKGPPPGLDGVFDPVKEALRLGAKPFLAHHWAWLFPVRLLREHGVLYPEDLDAGEVLPFLGRIFFHSRAMVWLPDVVYHWIRRPGSLTTSEAGPKRFHDTLNGLELLYAEAQQNDQPGLADTVASGIVENVLTQLVPRLRSGAIAEEQGQAIFTQARGICERQGVFSRLFTAGVSPQELPWGLLGLWQSMQDQSIGLCDRLNTGFGSVEQAKKLVEYEQIRQSGWKREIRYDRLDLWHDKEQGTGQGLLRARYLFCDSPPAETLACGGQPLQAASAGKKKVHEGEGFTIYERILWLPVPLADGQETSPYVVRLGEHDLALNIPLAGLWQAFAPAPSLDTCQETCVP